MAAGNGPAGYGWVSRTLHWTTVAALAAQFGVGYVMDPEDSDYLGEADTLVVVHVVLGLLVIVLAASRLLWRRLAGLPPWSEHLGAGERRLAHWTERVLLTLLLVVPATGLVVVFSGDDDVLVLHVAAHLAFFAALAAHLFLTLRPRILRRML